MSPRSSSFSIDEDGLVEPDEMMLKTNKSREELLTTPSPDQQHLGLTPHHPHSRSSFGGEEELVVGEGDEVGELELEGAVEWEEVESTFPNHQVGVEGGSLLLSSPSSNLDEFRKEMKGISDHYLAKYSDLISSSSSTSSSVQNEINL